MRRLLAFDAYWSQRLRLAERPGPLRTLAAILAHSGDSWFWAAGLLALIIFLPSWRPLGIAMLAGILVTAAFVFPIKLLVRRRRPPGEWGGIYRSTDPHSFPSGHAARVVMLVVVAFALGPFWLGVLLLVWAPLVSLARVVMGVHYLSDVLAGMLLGLVTGPGVAAFIK
jgi:undecaprenyl-diphosphatase